MIQIMINPIKIYLITIIFILIFVWLVSQNNQDKIDTLKRDISINHQRIQTLHNLLSKMEKQLDKETTLSSVRGMQMIATAYCNSKVCINVPAWRDGKTATGTKARIGVIAVDPAVIPPGSTVYIKGMGYFKAEDTGGAIKGNRIDIFVGDYKKAKEFGRKKVEVIIL